MDPPWIEGYVSTPIGKIPKVSTKITICDRVGEWKVRWGIGRMRYSVEPGLYAVGSPRPDSPVLVTANYKLTFDRLRRELSGLDVWIMVLDTKGINVWCAAGKGTFGTNEVVARIATVRLSEVVSHRMLILPQLGASGVAAHEVRRRSGFGVIYGPVRAADIPTFLAVGMKATSQMRQVRFPIGDRAAVIPVELIIAAKYYVLAAALFVALSGLGPGGYSAARALTDGWHSMAFLFAALAGGAIVTPLLLPWLPGRLFSVKGAIAGVALALIAWGWSLTDPSVFGSILTAVAWLALIPSVASFLAMNFTGASTYTSPSGVRREMRMAIPVQIALAVVGLGFWVAGRFV